MKIKTSELIGAQLDWAVAKCESKVLGEDIFCLKPIIAAMRCFCASKLGDEVEIPEELL